MVDSARVPWSSKICLQVPDDWKLSRIVKSVFFSAKKKIQ
jgi:hypothetical protein